MAKELVTILKPFEVATTFLTYEENTTFSVILPFNGGIERVQ